jgi:hypothetical protein
MVGAKSPIPIVDLCGLPPIEQKRAMDGLELAPGMVQNSGFTDEWASVTSLFASYIEKRNS